MPAAPERSTAASLSALIPHCKKAAVRPRKALAALAITPMSRAFCAAGDLGGGLARQGCNARGSPALPAATVSEECRGGNGVRTAPAAPTSSASSLEAVH